MNIIAETRDYLVCVKPSGFLSQKGEGANMIDTLGETKGEIFPVHRLDRETAGLMVFARSARAASILSAQISGGGMHKRYYAVTKEGLTPQSGEMKDLLFRDMRNNKTFVVTRKRRGVKEASLEYSLVCEKDGFALWDILLHTGRSHQIRAQFASRGYPLAGDRRYGGEKSGGLGLFAYSLSFTDPESGEKLEFEQKPDTGTSPFNIFGECFL